MGMNFTHKEAQIDSEKETWGWESEKEMENGVRSLVYHF